MGEVSGASPRALDVVNFFKEIIGDLQKRSAEVDGGPSAYVGGIAFRGPHGFLSTEPTYPPFLFTGAKNVAAQGSAAKARHAVVDREALLRWDPQVIFVDLSTLTASVGGALVELRDEPLWAELSAVKNQKIYGVLPYNWYTQNFGNILADAYFVGSILFPDRFADVNPSAKADDIYRFLVGKSVFKRLNEEFDGRVFQRLDPGR